MIVARENAFWRCTMSEKKRLLVSLLVFLLAAASLMAGGKAEAPAAAGEKAVAARAPSPGAEDRHPR